MVEHLNKIGQGDCSSSVLAQDVCYENSYLTVIRQVRVNKAGQRYDCFLKQEADVAVCVVIADGKFVMVEEYRPGPDRVLLEVPGGNVDHGEDPAAAARREVMEETGYDGQMTHIVSSPISAYSTTFKHVYLMVDAKQVAGPSLDSNEESRIVLLSRKEFERNAFAGNLTDLDAAMAVMLTLGAGDASCG